MWFVDARGCFAGATVCAPCAAVGVGVGAAWVGVLPVAAAVAVVVAAVLAAALAAAGAVAAAVSVCTPGTPGLSAPPSRDSSSRQQQTQSMAEAVALLLPEHHRRYHSKTASVLPSPSCSPQQPATAGQRVVPRRTEWARRQHLEARVDARFRTFSTPSPQVSSRPPTHFSSTGTHAVSSFLGSRDQSIRHTC